MTHIGEATDRRSGHGDARDAGGPCVRSAARWGYAILGAARAWLKKLATEIERAGLSLWGHIRWPFVWLVARLGIRACEPASVQSGDPVPSRKANARGNSRPRRPWGVDRSRAGAPVRTRRRAPPMPDNRLWLDLDERIAQGDLVPGTCREGEFVWRYPAGYTDRVNYEADMTDPAGGWVRLWFCNHNLKTGNRQVVDQYVRMAASSDGHWQFVVGHQQSSRLYLRPGGKGFKCPTMPGACRNRRKRRWPLWQRRKTANKAANRCTLHIDEMFRGGALKVDEIRYGIWNARIGDGTFPFKFASDLWDRQSPHLWLYYLVKDGTAWRQVKEEIKLARGNGQWWFKQNGRIWVELVLRNNHFRAPRVPRPPSKSSRHLLPQEEPDIAGQTADNVRLIAAPQSIDRRRSPPSRRRKSWLSGKLAQAKKAATRFVGRTPTRKRGKARMFVRARPALDQIVKAWNFLTNTATWLFSVFVRRQHDRPAVSSVRQRSNRRRSGDRWSNSAKSETTRRSSVSADNTQQR